MQSKVFGAKRLIVARFDEGEDLLLSLKRCAEEHKILSGWFSLFGGAKEVSYGLYKDGEHRNFKRIAKGMFELLPTVGNIAVKEGETFVHCHMMAADEDGGNAFGGHLMEGTGVFPFAEVFIQECDGAIERAFDERINLWPLKF